MMTMSKTVKFFDNLSLNDADFRDDEGVVYYSNLKRIKEDAPLQLRKGFDLNYPFLMEVIYKGKIVGFIRYYEIYYYFSHPEYFEIECTFQWKNNTEYDHLVKVDVLVLAKIENYPEYSRELFKEEHNEYFEERKRKKLTKKVQQKNIQPGELDKIVIKKSEGCLVKALKIILIIIAIFILLSIIGNFIG